MYLPKFPLHAPSEHVCWFMYFFALFLVKNYDDDDVVSFI